MQVWELVHVIIERREFSLPCIAQDRVEPTLFGLSGNPQSLNRYLLVLFPVYILLAQIRSEAIRIAIIIAFGLGLGIEAFFFMNEMWAG